jgi:hypothetical protein
MVDAEFAFSALLWNRSQPWSRELPRLLMGLVGAMFEIRDNLKGINSHRLDRSRLRGDGISQLASGDKLRGDTATLRSNGAA